MRIEFGDPNTIELKRGEHIWCADDDKSFCIIDKLCRAALTPVTLQKMFNRSVGLGFLTRFLNNYTIYEQQNPPRMRRNGVSSPSKTH